MDLEALRQLMTSVRAGRTSVPEAVERLRGLPFESLGFATVDRHRAIRCGFPEVIFCPGKTAKQVREIFGALAADGGRVLATRAAREVYEAVAADFPAAEYHPAARAVTLRQAPSPAPIGHVAVVAAGTSDLAVAEEARVTAEIMDARVTTHYDVGVAGLHRVLAHREALQAARAIVVVAGMEGALGSVVGGLVAVPVVAVPTSVGYGASFGGLAALLALLNSCTANVCVVNIDNGFGGGYVAAMINRGPSRSDAQGAGHG
jgi:hypothetical protein